MGLLLAASGAACDRGVLDPLITGAEPGDLVVAAVIGEDGRAVRMIDLDRELHAQIEIQEGERAVAWTIRGQDLVAPDGLPLGPERVSQARARLRDAPTEPEVGQCGRCLGRIATPPQIVYAGDSCPIPIFAAAAIRGTDEGPLEVGAEARNGIRIEWPGACACEPPPSVDLSRARIVGRRAGEWPAEIAAQAADGTVAVFGSRLARRIGPGGATRDAFFTPEGALVAGAGTADGRFLLASQAGSQWQNRGAIFDEAFEAHAVGSLPFSALHMKRVRGFSTIFVAGRAAPGEPGLFACEVISPSSPPDCRSLLPRGQVAGFALHDVANAGSGQIVAVGDQGAYVLLREQSGAWQVLDSGALSTFIDPGTGAQIIGGDLQTVGSVEGRLFACAESGVAERPLWTATTPPSDQASVRVAWTGLLSVPSGTCGRFFEAPGRPDRIRISFSDSQRTLELGVDPADIQEVPYEPYDLETVSPGWNLGTNRQRVITRRSTSTASAPLELVYGSTISFTHPYPAVAARGDTFYTFGSDPLMVGPDGEGAPWPTGRLGDGDLPIAAAYDEASGTFLVAAIADGAVSLFRLALDRDRTKIDASALSGEIPIGLAPLAPGLFVVATVNALWFLEGDQLSAIVEKWDDPATDPIETEPGIIEPRLCLLGFYGGPLLHWMSVSGRGDGVAFASGCDGRLVRIDRAGATRVSMPAHTAQYDPAGIDKPPALSAVRVACPDQVQVAANGRESARERVRLWTIEPRSDDGAPVLADHPERRGLSGNPAGSPTMIFGAPASPATMVTFGGRPPSTIIPAGPDPELAFGAYLYTSAVNEGGQIMLTTKEGFLLLLSPAP